MSDIQKIVIGETTEGAIRGIFDHRIAQESGDISFNNNNRALKIRNLKSQVLSFIKRQPNSSFTLNAPEYKSDKTLALKFNNFVGYDDECSEYTINIHDSFVDAEVVQHVKVGKDITLRIKAE